MSPPHITPGDPPGLERGNGGVDWLLELPKSEANLHSMRWPRLVYDYGVLLRGMKWRVGGLLTVSPLLAFVCESIPI